MDFKLTSEQEALADSVRRFVEREYAFEQRRKLLNSDEGFSRTHWASFAELGWLGAGLSEEMGGCGGSAIEYAIVAERLGKALAVEPFGATVTALRTLEAIERDRQVIALIEQIVMGETIAVLAHGEISARGDPRIVETVAWRSGDEWQLNGAKSLVVGAPAANSLLVSARVDDGVGLFLVAPTADGLHTTPYRTVDNLRAADIRFDGVVAEPLAIGPSVMTAIEAGIDHGTVTLCAEAVGVMDAALWLTRDYLKTRQQFGQPIGNFQALQHRMADMLIQCELARSMLYQGLFSLDRGGDASRRGVSAMKTIVAEAALFVGRQAIQLHGGIGMTEEYVIGHYYKRLYAIAHLHGDQDMHIERFASLSAVGAGGG
jgi:alkylation response protein AidB-like acyl-CoA dehydrogenase